MVTLTDSREAGLSASDVGIIDVPKVVTDSSPHFALADFHAALPWHHASDKPDGTTCTAYERKQTFDDTEYVAILLTLSAFKSGVIQMSSAEVCHSNASTPAVDQSLFIASAEKVVKQ